MKRFCGQGGGYDSVENDKNEDVASGFDNVNNGGGDHPHAELLKPTTENEKQQQSPESKVQNSTFANDPLAYTRNNPCYLPQFLDFLPPAKEENPMGPIGPWAMGKADWSPTAGFTGIRPVVNSYSITRFSPIDWRARNAEQMKATKKMFDQEQNNLKSCDAAYQRAVENVTKAQQLTTENIGRRVELITNLKSALEHTIKTMADEISTLEEERVRLKKSLVILGVPESIARECIQVRAGRPESELLRDKAEEELVNELALIAELRRLLQKTLQKFEKQQVANRVARSRLEYDWTGKKDAFEIDGVNVALNNQSKIIMFHPGAIRVPPEQASESYWNHFSSETLEDCEKCREKSIQLRASLTSILLKAATDIRTQADKVEKAFTDSIKCIELALETYEKQLKDCLQKIADIESRIVQIQKSMRDFNVSMKVAQTRMDNRNFRPNVENCRDVAQQNLIDEVGVIQDGISTMLAELDEALNVKNNLMQTRGRLEREIMLKRRVLFLDRERCLTLRAHYPTSDELTGVAK